MQRATKIRANRASRKIINLILLGILIATMVVFVYVQNNMVFNRVYILESNKIPKSFVGYTICQISDIANKPMNTEGLVVKQNPDIIVINGDFSDTNGNYGNAVKLVNDLSNKYKVYITFGENDDVDSILSKLNSDVVWIDNTRIEINAPKVDVDEYINKFIEKRYLKDADDESSAIYSYIEYTKQALLDSADAKIELSGLGIKNDDSDFIGEVIDVINLNTDNYKIVVNSQYRYFNKIAQNNVDLLLSSSSYGIDRYNVGYSKGIYSKEATRMSLTAGIGDGGGFRILNYPEINTLVLSDGTINTDNPLEKFLNQFISDVPTRFDNDEGFQKHVEEYNNQRLQRELDKAK